MALNPTSVLPARFWAAQYDGTNGADIAAWFSGSVLYEAAGTMVLLVGDEHVTVHADDWAVGSPRQPGRLYDVVPDAAFTAAWTSIP